MLVVVVCFAVVAVDPEPLVVTGVSGAVVVGEGSVVVGLGVFPFLMKTTVTYKRPSLVPGPIPT